MLKKTDWGGRRNHLPQPRQMMRVWGTKNRMENRKEQKERNREWVPNPATLDHLAVSYDPHGSYGRPILKHRGYIYIYLFIY